MPKTGKSGASQHFEAEGFDGHYEDLDGYTIGFETYTADSDMAPLFKGLPDDRCQCPHWGYVIKGKLVYHYASGDDVITTGEGYFAKPGHTPEIFAGTEIVEFSPTAELNQTLEVVSKNMEAMG
ncbi:MAG: cupin domain-containing protein [Actinomycetota bacterium]